MNLKKRAILFQRTNKKGSVAMSVKKEKKTDLHDLDPEEKLKYEIAEELGLLDRVLEEGWKSLTSKETGRIGGMITRKKRQEKNHTKN